MNLKEIPSKVVSPSLPHRRRISQEEQHYLAKICTMAFNTDVGDNVVERLMSYINFVEKKMLGRMASHVEDLVVHYLMRYHASADQSFPDDAVHLEIGTLFGGTVLIAHHALTMAESRIPIHVIDPFEGYYGRGKDIITGEEICQENFLKNLDLLGVPREDVVVHKGLSTDEKIIAECQSLKLRSLLIDGDHSYNGVKNDWICYAHLVQPGGYVMIDNYNDFYWPDVMSYVNKELLPNTKGKWEVLLVYANSLLLRRTQLQDDDDAAYSMKLYREIREREAISATNLARLESLEKVHQERIADMVAEHQVSRQSSDELLAKVVQVEQAFQAEAAQLLAQLSTASQTVESLQKENDEFKGQTQLLQDELASLRASYQEVSDLHQVQRRSTVESLEKLKQIQEIMDGLQEAHCREVVELHKELKKGSDTHRDELLRQQEEHARQVVEYLTRAEGLQAEIARLTLEKAQLESELAQTRKTLEEEAARLHQEILKLRVEQEREVEELNAELELRLEQRIAEIEGLKLELDRQQSARGEELLRLEATAARSEAAYRDNLKTLQDQLAEAGRARQEDVARLEAEKGALEMAKVAEVAACRESFEKRQAELDTQLLAAEKLRQETVAAHQAALQRLEQELRELRTRHEAELNRLHAEEKERALAHGAELEKVTSLMQEAIADHRRHRDELERELSASRVELQAVQQRMQKEKEALVEASSREASRLSAEIANLETELRQRDDKLRDLENSLSWKITSPFRSVGKTLSGKGE